MGKPLYLLIFTLGLPACTTFSLADHSGLVAVSKHRRAQDATAAVVTLTYEPSDPDEKDAVSNTDLARWQQILADALDRSNILSSVEAVTGPVPPGTRYRISGSITKFNFQKNWIPTLFPIHAAASFFTFTAYTWLGGPTSVTDVDFGVRVEVTDLESGEAVGTFEEQFEDMALMNVYTSGTKNPYNNPDIVFRKILESLATRIAAALPEEPNKGPSDTTSGSGPSRDPGPKDALN